MTSSINNIYYQQIVILSVTVNDINKAYYCYGVTVMFLLFNCVYNLNVDNNFAIYVCIVIQSSFMS